MRNRAKKDMGITLNFISAFFLSFLGTGLIVYGNKIEDIVITVSINLIGFSMLIAALFIGFSKAQ